MLDGIALIAVAAVVFGVAYLIYLNKIHEKELPQDIKKTLALA